MKLAPLEMEVIDLFVQLARLVSIPKSVAEIYGLLFVTPHPLAMDAITERLSLSKGSASQGLKLLRGLGAVRTVYVGGKRNDHYEPETEFRHLVAGLFRDKVQPHVLRSEDRLGRIEQLLNQMAPEEQTQLSPRLKKLRNWQEQGNQLLPLLQQALGH